MSEPLVSVFIPYYNDSDFLAESISSVINQTYRNIEIILLNHACKDESRDIAHSFDDERIRHIDMPYNLGYGGSGLLVKEFLNIAQGDYFKLFCADDILRPDAIRLLVDYMQANPKIDFAFGNVEYIHEDGQSIGKNWFSEKELFSLDYKEEDCIYVFSKAVSFLPYIGNFIRKSAFRDIQLNTTFVYMFDMSLWLSFLINKRHIGFCDKIVASYRISSQQTCSVNKMELAYHFSQFEWSSFYKLFLKIDDVDMARKAFKDDPYSDKLTEKEDIPFVVAHYFLHDFAIYSYPTLTDMLNDDNKRERIDRIFGYGVRELRKEVADKLAENGKSRSLKKRIYKKNIKNLNVLDLLFLLIRRILFVDLIGTIRRLFRKKKEKEKLTV